MQVEPKQEDNNLGFTVQDFLSKPDRLHFRKLYQSSFVQCRGYLRYLRSKRWQLPLDDRSDKDPIDDLAIDILGFLYSTKSGRPFYNIFEYFQRHGVTDFRATELDILAGMFMVLLRGFTRKKLYHLNRDVNPALFNIKKRMKVVLSGKDYTIIGDSNDSRKYVYLTVFEKDLRRKAKPIDRKLLEELVKYSILHTSKDTDLCQMFFRKLDEAKEYQNFVALNELLTVIVSARATFAEEGFPSPSPFPSPESELLLRQVEEAKKRALQKVWKEDIGRFVSRERITAEVGNAFLKACKLYLDDHCNGGCDLIPNYFKETAPKNLHKQYRERLKYPFETVIERVLTYFCEDFNTDSTNSGFGDY